MGRGKGHVPIRTCISCDKKGAKKDLVRLTLDTNGQLVRDDRGIMKGRGAYVCDSRPCLAQLSKTKRLNRAFRSRKTITISRSLLNL